MIKNLNQLKNTLKEGSRFEIIDHCRPECIGQLREITKANTQGFYSIIVCNPEHKTNSSNGGKGPVLWWNKAPFWKFENGICYFYDNNKVHTKAHLLIAFKLYEKEAA